MTDDDEADKAAENQRNVLLATLRHVSVDGEHKGRIGSLQVSAPRLTRQELSLVMTCLEHPPLKPDLTATLMVVLSGLAAIGKTTEAILARKPPSALWWEVAILVVVIGLVAIAVWRYTDAVRKKHPFHLQALKYVTTGVELSEVPDEP